MELIGIYLRKLFKIIKIFKFQIKLIYGQWASYFIKCYMEKDHLDIIKVKNNFLRKVHRWMHLKFSFLKVMILVNSVKDLLKDV